MNDKTIVIVIDDDPIVLDTITKMIESISPQIEVLGFVGHDVLTDDRIFQASLFVVDIMLADMDGRELALSMPQVCRSTPFLFISGKTFTENQLSDFNSFLTVDFISKPFGMGALTNRIKILLAVSGQARRYLFDDDAAEVQQEFYTFLPFVALVLDDDMRIRYTNGQLRYVLGVETSAELYNRPWVDFVPESEREEVKYNFKNIVRRITTASDGYIESAHAIIEASGHHRLMKWGNTLFQGGAEQDPMILSISSLEAYASPLMRKKRQYWQNQIIMHRAAIKDIRRRLTKEKEHAGMEDNTCSMGLLNEAG